MRKKNKKYLNIKPVIIRYYLYFFKWVKLTNTFYKNFSVLEVFLKLTIINKFHKFISFCKSRKVIHGIIKILTECSCFLYEIKHLYQIILYHLNSGMESWRS